MENSPINHQTFKLEIKIYLFVFILYVTIGVNNECSCMADDRYWIKFSMTVVERIKIYKLKLSCAWELKI